MPAAKQPSQSLHDSGVKLDVKVSNTGSVNGAVAIQLYLSTPQVDDTPLRSLVRSLRSCSPFYLKNAKTKIPSPLCCCVQTWQAAFTKVVVAAGSETTVTLDTGAINGTCLFCIYDAKTGVGSVPKGVEYQLFIGDGANEYLTPFQITSE